MGYCNGNIHGNIHDVNQWEHDKGSTIKHGAWITKKFLTHDSWRLHLWENCVFACTLPQNLSRFPSLPRRIQRIESSLSPAPNIRPLVSPITSNQHRIRTLCIIATGENPQSLWSHWYHTSTNPRVQSTKIYNIIHHKQTWVKITCSYYHLTFWYV